MKKILSLFMGIILVCLFLTACHRDEVLLEDMAAGVNGVYISWEQVDNRILIHKIQNDAFAATFSESYYEEEYQKNLEKVWMSTEKEDVLRELVEAEVLRQQCEEDNITIISYVEAEEMLMKEFQRMKTDDTQKVFYTNLIKSLETNGVQENVFLELASQYSYDFYNVSLVKQDFNKNQFDEKSPLSLDEQFQEYVDQLIIKAGVIYANSN